ELIGFFVIGAGKLFDVRVDNQIRASHATNLSFRDDEFHGTPKDTESGLNVLCAGGGDLQVHGDNDVSAHFADNIGGEIGEQAAVHEDFVALANGSENSGNRYGGAHGIGERAIRKDERFSGDEFSGNATEGNRQFVEGRNVGVIEGFAVDQEIDLVAGVEAL